VGITLFVLISLVAYHTLSQSVQLAPDPDFPQTADQVGIRWYTLNNTRISTDYDTDPPNASAPTIVFVHGWQPTGPKTQRMESFNYENLDPKYGFDKPVADSWLKQGYNVGLFYWVPYATESDVEDSEAKIWSTKGKKKHAVVVKARCVAPGFH